MEAPMLEHHKSDVYLNWAHERIDEINATLVALEKQVRKLKSGSHTKGEQLIADLRQRRDEFTAAVKKQAEASEAMWERTKPDLESQWNVFNAKLKTYFDTIGEQVEQKLDTFQDIAAAQTRAWRDAADKFAASADKLAAGKRPGIDAAIKQMKTDAAEMEAHLNKLKHAGQQSWSALSGALDQSRRAFDKANQKAWDAFKRAAG
jgi:hypothetical protein